MVAFKIGTVLLCMVICSNAIPSTRHIADKEEVPIYGDTYRAVVGESVSLPCLLGSPLQDTILAWAKEPLLGACSIHNFKNVLLAATWRNDQMIGRTYYDAEPERRGIDVSSDLTYLTIPSVLPSDAGDYICYHRWTNNAQHCKQIYLFVESAPATTVSDIEPTRAATEAPTRPVTEEVTRAATTRAATEAPTRAATEAPTRAVTEAPTKGATTRAATEAPTRAATTRAATEAPTRAATTRAATTRAATEAPTRAATTRAATEAPTRAATTRAATEAPTRAATTRAATEEPTRAATTRAATEAPTRAATTRAATEAPTRAATTRAATEAPTRAATTRAATEAPTRAATTRAATEAPTTSPTKPPTGPPTDDPECSEQPDGHVPDYGCVGYTVCRAGLSHEVDCTPDVFNPAISTCDKRENTEPPCGLMRTCDGKEDGRYADFECKAFYTCNNGQYAGHNPCPGGLVFNERLSVCDWPYNVPPPCGTKQP